MPQRLKRLFNPKPSASRHSLSDAAASLAEWIELAAVYNGALPCKDAAAYSSPQPRASTSARTSEGIDDFIHLVEQMETQESGSTNSIRIMTVRNRRA